MIIFDKTVFRGKDERKRPKRIHSFFLGTDFFIGVLFSSTPRMPVLFEIGIGVLHFTYVLNRCFYND